MSEPENRPRVGEIIEALHDREINGCVLWIFDGTWNGARAANVRKPPPH
jgi:hypothetical protein